MQAWGHKSATFTGGDQSGCAKLHPQRLLLPQSACLGTRKRENGAGGEQRLRCLVPLCLQFELNPPVLLTKDGRAQPQPPAGDAALPQPHTGHSPTLLSPAGWVHTSTPLLGNPGGHPHHTPAPFPPPQQVQGSPFQTQPLPANVTHVMDWGNFPPRGALIELFRRLLVLSSLWLRSPGLLCRQQRAAARFS